MTDKSVLLPCRRCRNLPDLHECDWTEPSTWSAFCHPCGITVDRDALTRTEAISAWNELMGGPAPTADVAEMIKRLKEASSKWAGGFPVMDEAAIGLSTLSDKIESLETALRAFVEWHGAAHERGCPEDDTCSCAGKPINNAVNRALRDAAPTRPEA